MSIAKQWLHCAEDNLRAAATLASAGRYRSAVSRAYYSAHNASHAIATHFVQPEDVPPRGTWKHGQLPGLMRKLIAEKKLSSILTAELTKNRLASSYRLRVDADYAPSRSVSEQEWRDARGSAAQVLTLAKRLFP